MKLKIARDTLLSHIGAVIGATGSNQTKKILENIYISASTEGVRLLGTDLELELSSIFKASVEREGATTVSAKKILDICKALPASASVTLETKGGGLYLKGSRSRFKMATLPADSFPILDDITFNDELKIEEGALKFLLDKTAFSMASQDVRYYLNGLHLDISENKVKSVSTNGHRLSYLEYEYSEASSKIKDRGVIIPRKAVLALSKFLDVKSESFITMQISSNHVRVQKGEKRLTSKLISGRYPDYQAAIPKNNNRHIVLNRTALKEGVSRISILSNEKLKSVTLRFSDNTMTIKSSNNDKEKAEEASTIEYAGEALEISFNVAYLLDIVNNISSEELIIGITDSKSSALITPKTSDGSKYVIMPLRM